MTCNRSWALPALFAALSLSAAPSAFADPVTVFSSGGSLSLPETISLIPAGFGSVGGNYFVPDAKSGQLLVVPAAGGAPTVFATIPTGSISGLFIPSGYGALSGSYLVTGGGSAASVVNSAGVVSTLAAGTSPEGSTIAPAGFGALGGKVLLGNLTSSSTQILVLNANGTTSVFATLPAGTVLDPFSLGFAPAGFGTIGGDLLVSDGSTGKIYAIDASGNVTLFDTLPTPVIADSTTGLRQFTFAPDGYGSYGGDLFISVSGSSNGGGSLGSVDIINGSGQLVSDLIQGAAGQPYDPRGLYFASDSQLLISDGTSGSILSVEEQAFSTTPEPTSISLLALGMCGIVAIGMRTRRAHQA